MRKNSPPQKSIAAILSIFCILSALSACATFRPIGDNDIENATGVRSRKGGLFCGFGKAPCMEELVASAKADCVSRGEIYEYVSHTATGATILNYRCSMGSTP